MAKPIETLSIKLDFKDPAGAQHIINKLSSSLKGLDQIITGNTKPAIQKLRNEINTFAGQGNKSISTIDAQVTALRALRREADINSREFKELTADISKYEKQLAKAGARGGPRGGGARQATQIAGAVISGGIFGGPEGALGAVGGAALGGVEGAFAGAAIGAAVGGVRQTIGETAQYAAGIDKLKIALEGVAPSTADYNSALAKAGQVTKELNVPQQDAIAGITRLTAAVVGAKGPVSDAETVFENVTAAIKATGGNSEDVKGAITAMVQVFSKGKVSAEELSGQLGERLPGAVTLFAKANNMSLQELQDNLKKGTVGLNELMAFVRELGVTYGGTAREISQSGAEAGARLTVSVNELRIAVGNAMKDVGAGFQEGFAEFITEITPGVTKAATDLGKTLKALGPIIQALGKNLDTIAVSLTGALSAAAIAAIVVQIKRAGSVTLALKNAVDLLNLSMLKNPIFLAAMGGALAIGGIYALTKAISEQADEVERLNRANDLAGKVENREYAQGSQQVAEDLGAALRIRGAANTELNVLAPQIKALREQVAAEKPGIAEESLAGMNLRELVQKQQTLLETRSKMDEQIRKLRPLLATTKELGEKAKTYEDPKPGDSGAGSKIKDITEAQLNAAVAQLDARQRIATLDEEAVKLKREQFVTQRDTAIEAAKEANAAKNYLEPNKQALAIKKAEATFTAQNLQLDQQVEAQAKRKLQVEQQQEALILRGRLMAGEITQEQFDQEQKLQSIKGLLELQPELYEKIKAKLSEAGTALKKFQDGVKNVFEEAINLKDALAVRGVQAVQQFGDAFADFVATGKSSFKELTASILQDLARIFARAALFKSLSLIPGVGDFLGLKDGGVVKGMTPPTTMPDSVSLMAANGMAFAKNKIVPYAKGGIVNKPTLFQYANGGSGRFGLMGEAGAEAIMPLRRGRNGKLGVESSGSIGNVVVNVDASGSSAQGDQPNAKALGQAIGAAVQAELIKQKRPGGLLS